MSLTGITALWPRARHVDPILVLVQPRKTHPYITERLLMGHKESNQTKINCMPLLFRSFRLSNMEATAKQQVELNGTVTRD